MPRQSDDFLRQADANANTRGLSDLGISTKLPDKLSGPVLVLETICPKPLPAGMIPTVAISPQESAAVTAAKVSLPSASYAETSGTFVNFDGKVQEFKAALP